MQCRRRKENRNETDKNYNLLYDQSVHQRSNGSGSFLNNYSSHFKSFDSDPSCCLRLTFIAKKLSFTLSTNRNTMLTNLLG